MAPALVRRHDPAELTGMVVSTREAAPGDGGLAIHDLVREEIDEAGV